MVQTLLVAPLIMLLTNYVLSRKMREYSKKVSYVLKIAAGVAFAFVIFVSWSQIFHEGTRSFYDGLKVSLKYLLVVPPIQIASLLLAVLVNQKIKGIKIFRTLYYLPVITGAIIVGYSWKWIFSPQGLLNSMLQMVGILEIGEPIFWLNDSDFAIWALMFVTFWRGLGFYMVVYMAGLQRISSDLIEAAMIDGASKFQLVTKIVLPLMKPTIFLCTVLSIMAALQVFEEIFVMTAGASYIVQTFSENNMEFNKENFLKMNSYAKSEGLEVHIDPWALAGVFGGEAYSKFVLDNVDVWQKNNLGEPVPYACLNHDKTRAFVKGWVDIVTDLNIDYIFWDEPHFFIQYDVSSSIWGCRCEICQRKFRNEHGCEMPTDCSDEILGFKRNSINLFLFEILTYSREKGNKNGLCVIHPTVGESYESYWRDLVVSLPLEYFGTDPYWLGWNRTIEEMVVPQLEMVIKVCKDAGILSQIWLQGFKIKNEQIREWERGLDILLDSDCDLVGVWSYGCCNSLSYLDFNTSEKLWQILLKKVSDKS